MCFYPQSTLVASLFAVLAILSLAAAPLSAQVIYDDFDSPALDDRLWGNPGGVSVSQSGGQLHLSGTSLQSTSIGADQQLRGDLEIIMDWSGFQVAGTDGYYTLQLDELNQSSFYYVMREVGPWGSRIGFYAVGNSGSGGSTIMSSATSGRFKISRTGSLIEGFYDTGSGWVSLGTYSSCFTSDAYFQFGMSGLSMLSSDYVSYIGTPICAAPDIQVNGSDGPLTVSAGANVSIEIAMEPNLFAGLNGSEFIVATRSFGPPLWYRAGGNWTPSFAPLSFRSGALAPTAPTVIFNSSAIPAGIYDLYYVVHPSTGVADQRRDSVSITIQ